MQNHDKIYLNGHWMPSQSTRQLDVIHAATDGLEKFLEIKSLQPTQ